MNRIHEGLPPPGADAWVWLGGNQVRSIRRDTHHGTMLYLDRTDPVQNAYCDPEAVLAWRPAGGELQPPPTRQMIEDNEARSAITATSQRLDEALLGFRLI
jgi:hypothetical protein